MTRYLDSDRQVDRYMVVKFAAVAFSAIAGSRFWSYQGLPNFVYGAIDTLVSVSLITVVLLGSKKLRYAGLNFSVNVSLFIILPLVSMAGAAIYHGQALHLSLLVNKTIFLWLLYFVLHIFEIPAKWIIRLLIIIGCIWAFLTIVQQFTYPTFYFYTRDGLDGELLRAGVYRFMLEPRYYALFLILYSYNRFQQAFSIWDILLIGVGLTGFYYYGTRQYAFAAVVCLFLSAFLLKGKNKVLSLSIIGIGGLIVFGFADILLKSYIEMTNDQLQDSDDIRLLALRFYLFEYWPHWTAMLIGNGRFHLDSSYGRQVEYLMTHVGYYREDIGIIGAFNYYGILYVLNAFHINVIGLFGRFYDDRTTYLRFFFFHAMLLIFLSDDYTSSSSIPFFCFILYLVDLSYKNAKSNWLLKTSYHEENRNSNPHSQQTSVNQAGTPISL